MKKVRLAAASALAAAALVVAGGLPANAASFSPISTVGGSFWYNDGTDTFCVQNSGVGRGIGVKLTPSSTSRGPALYVSSYWDDEGPGRAKCVSLARAYEDTSYTASAVGWNNGRTQTVVKKFYS